MALNLALIDPFNRHSPQVVDCLLNEDGSAGLPVRLAHSPSGTWLAMASVVPKTNLLTVSIFDLLAGSKLFSFEQCILEANLAVFTWCGNSSIVAVTANGILYVFDPHLGQAPQRQELPKMNSPVIDVAPFFYEGDLIFLLRSGEIITSQGLVLLHTPLITDESTIISGHWHEPSGMIFLATSKTILVADLKNRRFVSLGDDNPSLSLGSTIQEIVADQAGTRLVAIMKDKSIRVISAERRIGDEGVVEAVTLTVTLKLLDAVNRWPWSMAGFSHDSELVWGSFREQGRHLVYLWDARTGAMVKMLEGPRDDLVATVWNPRRPVLITAGVSGTLFHWVPDYPARWTALVPGLEEIEENVIYQEREDEFDLPVEEELATRRRDAVTEQSLKGPVDVITRDHNELFVERLPLSISLGTK